MRWLLLGLVLVGGVVEARRVDEYRYEHEVPEGSFDRHVRDLQEQWQRYRRRAEEYREIADKVRESRPKQAEQYDRLANAYEKRAMRAAVQLRELGRGDLENWRGVRSLKDKEGRVLEERDVEREQETRRPRRGKKMRRQIKERSWHDPK